MAYEPGGGGRRTDGSITPFERHPASVGELDGLAGQLEGLAGRGVDLRAATDQEFRPAEASWEGLASDQLRDAPVGMRRDAAQAGDAMAWLAGAIRYWRSQVDEFNSRVGSIEGQRSEASADRYGVPEGDAFAHELTLARQEHDRQMRDRWWEAYEQFVDHGSRSAAGMLRDGPTAENLELLAEAGVWQNPPGAIELLMPRWQDRAMEDLAGDMVELAQKVNDPDYQPTQAELERLAEVLEEYGENDAFAYYFFNELGAEGTLELSGNLAFMAQDNPEGGLWDEDMASTIGAIQAGLGVALATATTRRGTGGDHPYARYLPGEYELDSDWLVDLMLAGRQQFEFGSLAGPYDGAEGHLFPGPVPIYGYQLLGPLLNHGDYHADFLSLVGGDMVDFEMNSEDGSEVWTKDLPAGFAFDGMRLDWSNGWDRADPAGFDPVIGLMNALDRNHEGGLQLLTGVRLYGGELPEGVSEPPDGHRLPRLDYLLTDREWPTDLVHNPANAHYFARHQDETANPALATFGSVLEGAAGLDDERAVDLVESIVYELNADEQAMGYENGEEIGDGQTRGSIDNDLMHSVLREPIGNIMADYVWDVNRPFDTTNSSMPGGRGAEFSETHILRVLSDLGKDEQAHATIREAEAVYAAANYEYYLAGAGDPNDDLSARIDSAEQVAGQYGSVVGALDYGAITQDWYEQLEADRQHNDDVKNDFLVAGFVADQVVGNTVGNVPVAGELANQFVGGVLDQAQQDAMRDNSGMVTYGVAETLGNSRQASADLAVASLYHSGQLDGLPDRLLESDGDPRPMAEWTEEDYDAFYGNPERDIDGYVNTIGRDTVSRLGNEAAHRYGEGVRSANETLNDDVFDN